MAQIIEHNDYDLSANMILSHLICQLYDPRYIKNLFEYIGFSTDSPKWEYDAMWDCMRDTFINEAQ